MDNSVYFTDEKVRFSITLHRFESGQKFAGSAEINIAEMSVGWGGRDTYTMSPFGSQTGLYQKLFNPGSFDVGLYWVVMQATIDLVLVQESFNFRVEARPIWLLGMFQ